SDRSAHAARTAPRALQRIRAATHRPTLRARRRRAAAAPVQPAWLLPPDRLQREVFVLQRHVVLQLVERQTRAAVAAQIRHLHLPRGPDSLDPLKIAVRQTPDDAMLEVVLDARHGIGVLADPENRSRVLGHFGALRRRLNLPDWRAVHA